MSENAYEELIEFLDDDEDVEAIVFGEFGWGGYCDPKVIPSDKQGVLLSLDEAKPLMQGWAFTGGYGAPESYATYVWTNKRVIWVTQYDGSTSLDHAPRFPTATVPSMPGG